MTSGSSLGQVFRITSFGESHGKALGVVIDGCPAGLKLDLAQVQGELDRRRPGQSKFVTPRKELDQVEFLSGVFEGETTGAPIMGIVYNHDVKSKDYSEIKDLFRPGHADFTYFAKYGVRDYRGGGRSSARETLARVIGGAVAKQLLSTIGVEIRGGVIQVGKVKAEAIDWTIGESNDFRFLDATKLAAVEAEIDAARKARDSVGAIVAVQACGVPVGLGEPVFGKIDAALASAMLSIPAVKGVEFGLGFAAAELRGSQSNDRMHPDGFASNHHGGVLGGLTSGAPIEIKIALKATSSLPQEIETINSNFEATVISTKGRHDPCVGLRAVPIAEAMAALVIVDYWLLQLAQDGARQFFSPHKSISYDLRK